jgi:regulator of protease activity HflC (stomatin/prohibitin superfamily)|tara:strand:+ start:1932 stop:2957 length:1026 start_codon:yes stop_codon:yes gene_type:complete
MYLEGILGLLFNPTIWLFILIVVIMRFSIKFVPQNQSYVIERFGKFKGVQEAGLNFLIPFIDSVAADRSLKEQAVDVPSQSAITKDNISLTVDGVLYFRVLDPYKATYGVDDYVFAVTQLAQTTMRSELGKMELDKTFEERDLLNTNIVAAINQASSAWGVQVLRYEIKDIVPPQSVMQAMEAQMKAERVKRAQILESEGDRQSAINRAEGEKASVVLAAEAEKDEQVLRAEGEAKALVAVADAQAKALVMIGEAADTPAGQKAVQLELATKAIHAKEMIAKESSLILLPDGASDAANLVTQAMAIIQKISNGTSRPSSPTKPSSDPESYVSSDAPGPWGK